MTQSEIDYYRKRAIQEQAAAQKAACPTAQRIHDELAAAYRFRVSMLSNAWAEAGMSIALQRMARQGFQQSPEPAEGGMSVIATARPAQLAGAELIALAG